MTLVPVQVDGLEKRYGARRAVAGIELEVRPGEIVALVGPNGSGKTTLLRILAGLARSSRGVARVFGLDPFRQRADVMRRARFSFAPPALFPALTAREHLVHLAAAGARRPARAEVDRALELVGLAERADDRVRAYSFGMRQRLALALALVPRPELVVLDEPTDGLDPLAVLELRVLLRRLREEHGVAVLLASHLLTEVDELVDRMLVLDEGRTVFFGAPAELVSGTSRIALTVDDPDRALEVLQAAGRDARRNGAATLELTNGALALEEARALLDAGGVRLQAFHPRRATLEEVLIERLREGHLGEERTP
jgi:ABC-2 type transport system ATP-binding protein